MAVFEGKSSSVTIDDTISLTCVIENAHAVQDHIEYILRVQRGLVADSQKIIQKRYNDFNQLDVTLRLYHLDLPLPPKKVFGNKDREFIAERQQGLQNYTNELLKIHMLANSFCVRSFLDPSNYSFNVRERALQYISMLFRSEQSWEVVEPAPDIGWRIRKAYFMVKNKTQAKSKYLLSWTSLGPLQSMEMKDINAVSNILQSLKHPYIYPVTMCEWNEQSVISISPFLEKGTLRDLICKAKPKSAFLKKYCNPKNYCICGLDSVKMYGRQILEALKFLHDKGIPYGHLHAGNVVVSDKTCQLMDVHSWLAGTPSYYKPFFVQHRKVQTVEDIDVYCFGHLVFEMAMGAPLNEPTCDNATLNCPPEIRSLIQSILSGEACKNGLPSLADVLKHCLFQGVELFYEKPQLKVSKVKETLKGAKEQFEKKIKEEQKQIHQHRRISKAKEFHMSDNEKRKRRRSKMKQLSQQMSEDADARQPLDAPSDQTSAAIPQNGTDDCAAPPPVLAPPPPPPPPVSSTTSPPEVTADSTQERSALLGSIRNFSKMGLKKADTQDKSQPRI